MTLNELNALPIEQRLMRMAEMETAINLALLTMIDDADTTLDVDDWRKKMVAAAISSHRTLGYLLDVMVVLAQESAR